MPLALVEIFEGRRGIASVRTGTEYVRFATPFYLFSIGTEATMALRMITEKAMGLVSKQYQAALGASLAQTGELPTHRLWMVGARECVNQSDTSGLALGIGGGEAP